MCLLRCIKQVANMQCVQNSRDGVRHTVHPNLRRALAVHALLYMLSRFLLQPHHDSNFFPEPQIRVHNGCLVGVDIGSFPDLRLASAWFTLRYLCAG
jgi:hypothetical protein